MKIIIILFVLICGIGEANAVCLPNSKVDTLSDTYNKAEAKNSAEEREGFNSDLNLVLKNEESCFLEKFAKFDAKVKAAIISRLEEENAACPMEIVVDEDFSWCDAGISAINERDCFDKAGKPFDWCNVYPRVLKAIAQ